MDERYDVRRRKVTIRYKLILVIMKIDNNIITITDKAAERVKYLIKKGDKNVLGLRIGVKSSGCSGFKYSVEYAVVAKEFEETISSKGVTIFIDPAAVMFLVGSEMDWNESKFSSGFDFKNPNETARCGCGESFSVSAP